MPPKKDETTQETPLETPAPQAPQAPTLLTLVQTHSGETVEVTAANWDECRGIWTSLGYALKGE